MEKLLYGVAYYDEYMPYDRLDTDIRMMKAAGINLVRIAESTWSTLEPHDGVFDFTSIDRVLAAMHQANIHVIVGTPTYAIPPWMAKAHPSVLAMTPSGQNKYGARQNMDIANPTYLFYAERVIRRLMEHVNAHPAVIGYQADNETKHYQTCGANVQVMFVKYLQKQFGSLDHLNRCLGFDYWSNRVNSWEDFPSAEGTINASLSAEFAKFQRKLVTDFLAWQVAIINEYKRPDQFVTHNFDFAWKGYSFGVQPDVDHFAASRAVDIIGVDIYHPTQSQLTGREISFGGDLARSLRGDNYFVLETEAQGFPAWVPYPGQLRLQAFSHLASGANMVEYWHWHSIHNACETYWKGLLSHDFEPNPTYEEAITIGKDFERLGRRLVNLKKTNQVAMLISNEALSAFDAFQQAHGGVTYNDVVRLMYDALYDMNIGCDMVAPSSGNLEAYRLLIVPALYAAPNSLLERLNRFVEQGGHIVYSFASGFCDEHVKVRATRQPGIIEKACGIAYSQFTLADRLALKDDPFNAGSENVFTGWMELLTPTTAKALAYYDHQHWGEYAALTQNKFGKGSAMYIGCLLGRTVMAKALEHAVKAAGLWGVDQELAFPLITKTGVNQQGKTIHYYLNYSADSRAFHYPHPAGLELLAMTNVSSNETVHIASWGALIIEEK